MHVGVYQRSQCRWRLDGCVQVETQLTGECQVGPKARGAHDLHAGTLGHLGHQLGVTTQVDRTRVDEGAHAVLGESGHALDRGLDARGAVPVTGGVELVARIGDADVLVHERWSELGRVNRAGDGVHGRHGGGR